MFMPAMITIKLFTPHSPHHYYFCKMLEQKLSTDYQYYNWATVTLLVHVMVSILQ